MSLMTTAYLLERYGPLLTVDDLSAVLHLEPGTIRNQMSARTLGVQPVKQGSKSLFRAEDVAKHIDALPTMRSA